MNENESSETVSKGEALQAQAFSVPHTHADGSSNNSGDLITQMTDAELSLNPAAHYS